MPLAGPRARGLPIASRVPPHFGMVLFAALLSTLLYLLAAYGEWRRVRQGAVGPRWRALAALIAHFGLHLQQALAGRGLDLHFLAALSAVALSMAAVTWLVSIRQPINRLGIVVYPLSALLAASYGLLRSPPSVVPGQTWQINLHALFALLAFGVLAIAAVVALLMEAQEQALRARRLSDVLGSFPPLATVESLLFQLIGAGFGLLTLTLVTGLVFVENLFAQHLVHKTVLSIAAWLIFGMLLVARWRYGWRGRRAVRWTLTGMLFLFLAFVGVKFVLEIVLHRTT